MLICIFTAFLFFVVRLPAHDQNSIQTLSPIAEPVQQAVHTGTVKQQQVLQFNASTEERQAA